jgi:hypothetical protein
MRSLAHQTAVKAPEERALVVRQFDEVEPVLRATCTHERTATRSIDAVVGGAASTS